MFLKHVVIRTEFSWHIPVGSTIFGRNPSRSTADRVCVQKDRHDFPIRCSLYVSKQLTVGLLNFAEFSCGETVTVVMVKFAGEYWFKPY